MDPRFSEAQQAIRAGEVARLRAILEADPELATRTSQTSHPTLMQAVAVEGGTGQAPSQSCPEMARILLDFGAPLDGPLVAATSVCNLGVMIVLLDAGASVQGSAGWTPLEEALYWCHAPAVELLLERGAKPRSLRAAAGLGDLEALARFVNEPAGIAWPFGPFPEDKSRNTAQDVLDNALMYAVLNRHIQAIEWLITRGANLNTIPLGFDGWGAPLHAAAYAGDLEMVKLLVANGADTKLKADGGTAAGWARHEGHNEVAQFLA